MESKIRRAGGRRGLLALVTAGAVSLVAIPSAQSTQGQPVIAGQLNTATQSTSISLGSCSGQCGIALSGTTTVDGSTGVLGRTNTGTGVHGASLFGTGVVGSSNSNRGVHAITHSGSHAVAALVAENQFIPTATQLGGDGIEARTLGVGRAAVFAHHDNTSAPGNGVWGLSQRGYGVRGTSRFASGYGVLAENTAGGAALRVEGKASFLRDSVITIPAGSSSYVNTTVSVGSGSYILATLQTNAPGVYVRAAVPKPPTGFTVYLNTAAPTGGVRLAYIIID